MVVIISSASVIFYWRKGSAAGQPIPDRAKRNPTRTRGPGANIQINTAIENLMPAGA
jgi:hypothetical protein